MAKNRAANRQEVERVRFRDIIALLNPSEKFRLMVAVIFRIIVNSLDILALTLVAAIAFALTANFGGASGATGSGAGAASNPLQFISITNELDLIYVSGFVVALFLGKSVISIYFFQWFLGQIAKIETRIGFDVLRLSHRSSVNASALQHGVGYYQGLLLGSTNSLLSQSLSALVSIVAEASLVLLIVGAFFVTNPYVALFLTLYIAVVLLVLNFFMSGVVSRRAVAVERFREETLTGIGDLFGANRETFLAGKQDWWIKGPASAKGGLVASQNRLIVLFGMPRYVIESALIVGFALMLGGIILFSDIPSQAVTIGVLLAGGLRLIATILPLQASVNQQQGARSAGLVAYRLLASGFGDKETKTTIENTESVNRTGAAFELRRASCQLGSSNGLYDIDLAVEPGKRMALVGPSGAGKSSLLDVLMGFRPLDSGEYILDGRVISEVSDIPTGTIALVPQRPALMHATLAQNITLSEQITEAEHAELDAIVVGCGLEPLLARLHEGIDTQVGPSASKFSGGELQRLGLARALFQRPRLLLLDEFTSALDADSESSILQALKQMAGNATVIVIAHRLSTVRDVDQVCYLSDGRIIGRGSFDELSKSLPEFSRDLSLLGITD